MSSRSRHRLPVWLIIVGLAFGLCWAGWLGSYHLAGRASVLDRAEASLADLRLLAAGRLAPPANVAIVAIDDATVSAEGGYPIDRARLAEIVEAIGRAGARAVAIDLLFVDRGNEVSDAALVSELARLPVVIAAAGRFDIPRQSEVPRTSEELWPLASFADVASVGLVNIATDAGGTPRHVPMALHTTEGLAPSFALRAASLFAGSEPVLSGEGVVIGGETRRLDLGWHLPLRYYGPEGSIETVSASALLEGRQSAAARLEGRAAVLGATATGVGDRFSTPFDRVLPGAEVVATAIAHLLEGTGLTRDNGVRRADVAATLALTVAGITAVSTLALVTGLSLFGLLVVTWMAAVTVLYGQGYWLSMTLPLAGPVPAVAALAAIREILDRRQSRMIARTAEALSLFQAPVLARRIADDPAFLDQARKQEAAILFVDLTGFTQLSESIGPARTRAVLKEFHTLVVDEIQARDGVVLNFMGDGAMIVFGIPDPRHDDAARALEAAHALLAAMRAWIRTSGMESVMPGVRIGAHMGPVILSRLGHDKHQQITAAGDSVNIASRLMEVGKEHTAALVASSALMEAAQQTNPNLPKADEVREVAIRGRRQRMNVTLWRASVQVSE